MSTPHEDLHRLVDRLPEQKALLVRQLVEALLETEDPLLHALANAPIDDEPLTPEEEEAIEEAHEAIARGEVSSLEEVERRLREAK